ncbi:MAG: hypothetical protein H0U09_05610 [Geodermatophilaceae bacterium]|nr:hypothetical protein [Geodermatophilaceae bacterium]
MDIVPVEEWQPEDGYGWEMRGRNSDNTLILERFGWEPSIPLVEGFERTYRWIFDQVKRRAA